MTNEEIQRIVGVVFEELEDEGWFKERGPRGINAMENQIADYCVSEFGEHNNNDEQ